MYTNPAPTDISSLSLHDALPISPAMANLLTDIGRGMPFAEAFERNMLTSYAEFQKKHSEFGVRRSEEHTSELQSHVNLVCRLLLEKKNPTLQEGPAVSGRRSDNG